MPKSEEAMLPAGTAVNSCSLLSQELEKFLTESYLAAGDIFRVLKNISGLVDNQPFFYCPQSQLLKLCAA